VRALGRTGLISQPPGAAAELVRPLFGQALCEDLAGPVRAQLHARAFAVLHAPRSLDAAALLPGVRAASVKVLGCLRPRRSSPPAAQVMDSTARTRLA